MDKIASIKVVSVDLFRTLVDPDRELGAIWKTLLRENYSEENFQNCRMRFNRIITQQFIDAGSDAHFTDERTLLEDTFRELSAEVHLDFPPEPCAEVLVAVHREGRLYEDTIHFLKRLSHSYIVCLSSDADDDMIPAIEDFRLFDHVFTSEGLKSYKFSPRFFNQVVEHYRMKPDNILHVGDSNSDVVGAHQCGITTCWLNRHDRKWNHPVVPDFEVKSLSEILSLLGLDKND
jgi:putative hydrolase of the HAD superfamily